MTMSIADRSSMVASSENVMNAPIYTGNAEDLSEPGEISGRRGRPSKRTKPSTKVRTRERTGERKFPMGLMMAVMVVAAIMIAMVIYILSGGPTSTGSPVAQTEGPAISSVIFNTNTDGSIQVEWTTDIPATGQVMFCDPDGVCSWTDKSNNLITDHSVTLADVKPNVSYHITVESIDSEGNKGQFESEQTFTGATGGSSDTEAPVISEVKSADVTDTGFVVTWTTDELSTSQVEYGTTQSYGLTTSVDSNLTTNHVVTVTGLTPNTSYYFRAVSADADGNTAKDDTASRMITLTAVAEGLQIGYRAPDFSLEDMSGNTVSLTSFYGKKMVILNFWATWCSPCVAELPYIQEVNNNWASSNRLAVLAANKQETSETIQDYLNDHTYTFTVLLDPGTVATKFAVNSIPTTYFIDSQGIIRAVENEGFQSASEIEAILSNMH